MFPEPPFYLHTNGQVCVFRDVHLPVGAYGRAGANNVTAEVKHMIAAVWLMLSGLMYSLQLSAGSFPKPLTQQEEQHYLELAAQGDIEARNILIERNLRLVAHVMNKS
jgi:RNA polymerase sporulation-specific sigma factor